MSSVGLDLFIFGMPPFIVLILIGIWAWSTSACAKNKLETQDRMRGEKQEREN